MRCYITGRKVTEDDELSRIPEDYSPDPEYLARFPDISGNAVNGLGEADTRRPSRFFWHPPEEQSHGELQSFVLERFREVQAHHPAWSPDVDRGPAPTERDTVPDARTPEEWTSRLKRFALEHDADLVGIAPLDPLWIYDGYEIAEPWVVMLGVAHDFDKIREAPSTRDNLTCQAEIRTQYTRAARAAAHLRNFILETGHEATAHQGPMAAALSMIPAAIAAGLGELGKHGSLINRTYGSNFRLAAVTTTLPLVADRADIFGADDFCQNCRACTAACPPQAIYPEKQTVRGVEKWYVDFDKCLPFFGEYFGCALCVSVCPWSHPGVAERLVVKMARRGAGKT